MFRNFLGAPPEAPKKDMHARKQLALVRSDEPVLTVSERLAKARQESDAKAAYASKLTQAPKRRK